MSGGAACSGSELTGYMAGEKSDVPFVEGVFGEHSEDVDGVAYFFCESVLVGEQDGVFSGHGEKGLEGETYRC